ncbi:putative transcriptional regulator [Alloalcanivorax dieselolei B5]|uniref:Putative transcriptional regulator n=1 Tax=Alcanivorax dieselolei (strain DSM 16502 / CGMCC 1.3690 / MCCC 1A00001 / B-5) TaxID=930169 RepID=K0CGU7_ALCDB|nr:LysR family transcriptional regulator [Alloalcanivorax dieselolei]AFT70977.1 putative transcriptional regulator [Alloalcanivorax dieselolei B5]GGK01147.1 LysR family transcriptional regulator [Alloalcanivorax dieselolei]
MDLPLLDIDVIRSFVAIAESGGFSRAAATVHRTPSALSMQIKRLEEMLDQPLFIREARQVRLTPQGEALLGYARRLLKLNEETVGHFLKPALTGQVRLGSPDDVGTRILPRVLARFARTHPAVQVDVLAGRSVDLVQRLNDGDLDMTLVTVGNDGLEPTLGEVVHSEPLVWAGRDGGLAVQRQPLPLSLANQGCAWRRVALAALDHAGIDYRIAYSSEHCAGQEAAMLADLAVAPFPHSLVKPPLRRLDNEAGLPELGHYQIALVRGAAGPAHDALAEQVKAAFRDYR